TSLPSSLFLLLFMLRPPPSPTLFPYTTLFRSSSIRFFNKLLHFIRLINIDELLNGWIVFVFFAYRNQVNKSGILFNENRVFSRRSEEHTSELQSRFDLVCRLLLEKKKKYTNN